MELPYQLLDSLEPVKGFDREAFIGVHSSIDQVTSIRINPAKNGLLNSTNDLLPVPWTEYGYYLPERPSFTFDPLFHAGCYYPQEASSMFIEQALKQNFDVSKPIRVLDLCAAPGGKSTHIQSLISKDSLLVSNEVIRSRANVLKENIIKWGCQNVIVTNNDPRDFSQLEGYFDVILVDAPCSGSGLFRKDPAAVDEWSLNNVALCSQRQQRILADVYPALKENGILIYATCSYSVEEDEEISNWLLQSFALETRPLEVKEEWNVTETGNGFRLWPDKLKGEGFYLNCFRKLEGEPTRLKNLKSSLDICTTREVEIIKKWMDVSSVSLMKYENKVYAWPLTLAEDFKSLFQRLRVIYSGVFAGELMRDKFVPVHALAQNSCLLETVPRYELSKEEAIRFLQRKTLNSVIEKIGWQVVTYKNVSLGWINVLKGRINNYYPKELRIIKDN